MTVWARVLDQSRQRPEAPALRRCDGTSSLTYGALVAEAGRLAAALQELSVSARDRVAVLSDNGPETYVSVLACAKLGAIAVMVDGNLPPATVDRFCEITTPTAILLTPGSGDATARSRESTPVLTVAVPGATQGEAAPDVEEPVQGPDDPLAMIFTSGTTGEPKGVVLPNRCFFAVADILRDHDLGWIDWVVGEATYSPLPATHIGGLWWILNCLMQGGLCVTGGEGGRSLVEILEANDIATTCLVPTLLTRLVAELNADEARMPALRLVGYGGSRAIAADVARIEAAGVHTVQVYGLSETGCTALCMPTEEGSVERIEEGAVGRPYPGVEIFLADPGEEPPAAPGAAGAATASAGTLWVRSPANMLGYWDNPDRTGQVLVDGWINTGDILEMRDDGVLYIRGRSSEMIISGGVNIAPDEVDRIAESVAGVREAACFEIPDAEFGALVGLAVVATPAPDGPTARALEKAIATRFREQSEAMARPAKILVVESIPRTQSGKIIRAEVAKEAGVVAGG